MALIFDGPPYSETMDSDKPASAPPPARPVSARSDETSLPPTPVRKAMDVVDAGPSPVETDLDEVALEVDGEQWMVRVLGRSRGGPASAPTDLLLLGFSSSTDNAVSLECLVAGRLLSGLSELQLTAALRGGRPPLDPDRPRTLFPGTAERRKGRS